MFKKNKTKKINKAKKKNNTNNIGTYRETEEGGGEKPIKILETFPGRGK